MNREKEDCKILINSIKYLSKQDQFGIYQRCIKEKVSIKRGSKGVEIDYNNLTDDIIKYIKDKLNVNKTQCLKTNNEMNASKIATFGKYDEISSLIPRPYDETVMGTDNKEIIYKLVYNPLQLQIKKNLRECGKKIISCKKNYIEKNYGNDETDETETGIDDVLDDDGIDDDGIDDKEVKISIGDKDDNEDGNDEELEEEDEYNEINIEEHDGSDNSSDEELEEEYVEDCNSFFDTDFESILFEDENYNLDYMCFPMNDRLEYYKRIVESLK